MITIFGLKSCGTCKAATAWLAESGIAYVWRDVKKDGVDAERLLRWIAALGWEGLVNKRGTTWRAVPDSRKSGLTAQTAQALMMEAPSMIKRPIWEFPDGGVLVGFDDRARETVAARSGA